jgi:hypothetical protein
MAGMSKGQVSVELFVVIGFVLLLFIPLIFLMYYKTSQLNTDISGMEGRLISSRLASIANSVGSLGDGSALKAEFTLPAGASRIEFRSLGTGGEVFLRMDDGSTYSDVTVLPLSSDVNCTSGITYKLEFLATGGKIKISQSS